MDASKSGIEMLQRTDTAPVSVVTRRKEATAVVENRDWPGMLVTFEDGATAWYPMPVFLKDFEPRHD